MNIEAKIKKYLEDALPVPVSADVPPRRPASFVTIERTGGTLSCVVIDAAMIAVQSWAKTRYDAAELAEAVDTAMQGLAAETSGVTRCARNSGPYNFPDVDGSMGRYQAIYDITFYKEAVQ